MNGAPDDQSIRDYVDVLARAGALRRWDQLVSWVHSRADVIDVGMRMIVDRMVDRSMSWVEGWELLDSGKAVAGRHLMLRRAVEETGLDPHFLIARSDQHELAEFLGARPHPTAVVSLHLLGQEHLLVLVVTNFPVPGQRGPGVTHFSCVRVARIRDTFLPAVEDYAASVNAGTPDFALIAEPLAFLGSVMLTLLAGVIPTELIFIPHRVLHVLPLHAIALDDDRTVCLPDVVPVIRYVSSASDLTYGSTSLLARESAGSRVLLSVIDDAAGLRGTGIEHATMSAIHGQIASRVSVQTVTTAADLPRTFDDHVWINWNSHARSSTNSWGSSYLTIGDRRIPAADIASNWRFPRRPHVVIAACQTALDTTLTGTVDEYCGLDMAFRIAGASSVVASMWAASDPVAALTSMLVVGECLQRGTEPARSVTSIQRAMRHGVWKAALLRPDQLRQLPQEIAEFVNQAQQPFRDLPADAFTNPTLWSVFRCHG